MTNKKISVIVKYFYPVAAGIETVVLETYKILARKGWDITVHTTNDTLDKKNVLSKNETVEGIRVKRYESHWYGYSPKISADEGLISLHNMNVFPHSWIFLKALVDRILRRKNYTIVLTPHGGLCPMWEMFPTHIRYVKRFLHAVILPILINNTVDGIKTVSEWEKNEIIKMGIYPKLIEVFHNGTEKEAFDNIEVLANSKVKKDVKKLGTYILQVGRIFPIKNYETTIKSLQYIPTDIKLVIVGPVQEDDTYFNYLKNLAKKLTVENRVIFYGVVRGFDKYYLMKHALAMVHMSLWESYCNVVHEAMSQGTPCIVSNNTALPYLVKNGVNGFSVDTKDSESVAKKILYILKNKNSKIILEMRKKGIAYGKENSWENITEKTEKFYTSLMKGSI